MFTALSYQADKVNNTFLLILVISVILLIGVTGGMVFLALRYRRNRSPEPREVREPLILEITWTVIPTVLVFIMFYVGWKNFEAIRNAPENTIDIRVRGRMWSWRFEYANGITTDQLRVPVRKPVKLLMSSEDVNHSLFIPDFRVKEDVVPGLETNLWFSAARTGEHDIFCAEYCGQGHSSMNSKVIVLSEEEFNKWFEGGPVKKEAQPDSLQASEILDETGCLECHSTDGSKLAGPTFKGLFGRRETVITGGKERVVSVDEQYLRNSLLYPDADIVKDYPNIMPSYEGELSEEEITVIIQYLKQLQ